MVFGLRKKEGRRGLLCKGCGAEEQNSDQNRETGQTTQGNTSNAELRALILRRDLTYSSYRPRTEGTSP